MKRKRISKTIAKLARMITITFLQLTLLIGITGYAVSQEISSSVIAAGGETLTATSLSIDFVIGEIVTESYTQGGIMLTQGFLQGAEEGLAINEQSINAGDISVYPVPSSDVVYIMCKGEDNPLHIEIIDIQGCKVSSIQYANNPMQIDIKHLTQGLYVLKIVFTDHSFVTKRIIKNN